MAATREQIRERALALGFDAVGFAPAASAESARAALAGFIAWGWHGTPAFSHSVITLACAWAACSRAADM